MRLEQAGIPTVRFQAKNKPKVDAIRAMILSPTVTEAMKAPIAPSRAPVMPSEPDTAVKGKAATPKENAM